VDAHVDRKYRLTSVEMAQFVATGMVRLDAVVPAELNAAAIEALEGGATPFPYGTPAAEVHPAGTPIGDVLRLPTVAGAIQSLVGPNPAADHHYVHIRPPKGGEAQPLHADAVFDTRPDAFDVQMMYYPETVGPDDGGTLVVPGTHLRRTSHMDTARYQNIVGQVRLTCPAGTLMFLHHAIWHAGRRNDSDRRRIMFKLRFNPTARQLRLWNTDDIEDPAVVQALMVEPPWSGNDGRLELINRARMWRSLTGDESFDLDYYLTRTSLRPDAIDADATSPPPLPSGRPKHGWGTVLAP